MSAISSQQALRILTGSEGAKDNLVSLPPSGNSGLSFGKVQLDIGNNSHARAAYKKILALGVAKGIITQDDADFLAGFMGVKRPDLNPDYASIYKETIDDLNRTLFDPKSSIASEVNQIIRTQQSAHLDEVVPDVNTFLRTHTTGVFDPNDPNYAIAVAALVAARNRSGNLKDFGDALQRNSNPGLVAVKNAYATQIGPKSYKEGDWSLVRRGATNYVSDQKASNGA